ncbi:MAG: MFS transporter [Anaerolineae bacterium]|nr:MFS transporter [Anaerolineae bacterium]
MTQNQPGLHQRVVGHPLFSSLYFPSFLVFFAAGLLSAVTPIYMAGFDADYTLVGLMLSMGSFSKMLFTLPGGIIIPRLGLKSSMVMGLTAVAIGTAGFFFARTPIEVMLYQVVTGLGHAFYQTARLSYAAGATNSNNRGRSLSALGATNRLSSIISPALGGILAAAFGLRLPHLISAGFILVAAIVIVVSMKPEQAPQRRTQTNLRLLLRVAKANAGLLLRTGSGGILLTVVRFARFTLVPIFGSEVLGLDTSQIGMILSIGSLVDMLNFYSAGTIMDRHGRRAAAIPCVGIMSLGMVLMPFTTGFWGLLAVTALIGLGNGFGSGIMMTMGSDLAPAGQREEFLAIWILLLDAGGAACPLVVGGISDAFSLTASGFAFFAIGMVSMLAFWMVVPETRDTPSRSIHPEVSDSP